MRGLLALCLRGGRVSDRSRHAHIPEIPTSHDVQGLQLVLFWHKPRRCSCSGTLPTVTPDTPAKPLAAAIVVDRTPGRYCQLCETHGTPLAEVKETRKTPDGLWCEKGRHAPATHFLLYDLLQRKLVAKVSLEDPEDADWDDPLVQTMRKRV